MQKAVVPHKAFYSRGKQARILRPLFAEWHSVLSWATTWLGRCEYLDHPYWYGERSHVGWLTLAAYEKGWLPLQEPSVPRRGRRAGRSDLWIYIGRGANTIAYDFEAKDAELNLTSLKDPETFYKTKDIQKHLREALKQLKKPGIYKGDVGVALVFIVLYASKGSSKADQIESVTKFKQSATSKKVLKDAGADFMALYLAPYRYIKKLSGSDGPHFGVAVLGKRAR